ncbi:MAG: TIGR03936 family radical SAM-associated protein [Eggerthellaceae bacterium]|nr:TIGR03936 family radical SAM-associated protein [Eggerthellaceae bacterium]
MFERRLFRLRIIFTKQGRVCLLSHLELTPALERMVRRAALPFATTAGFSPHMKISCGAALPVGVGGSREFFDVYLIRYVNPDELLERLKEASREGLEVTECFYVENNAEAPSIAYPVSTYVATFNEVPADLLIPDKITVLRKKKEKTLCVSDYLVGDVETGDGKAEFSLLAKPEGSLRPDRFMEACIASTKERGGASPEFGLAGLCRVSQSDADGQSV